MPQLRTLAIRISTLDDGRLWASASGDGGQEDEAIQLPDDAGFAALLGRVADLSADAAAAEQVGRRLFDALLPGGLRRVYDGSVGRLGEQERLRLLLTFPREAGAFAALPWEYLHDPARGPLAQRGVSVVRSIAQAAPPPPLAVTLPLRVLLTAAQTDPPVDVRRELKAAEAALAALKDQVAVTVEPRLTMEKLRAHLRDGHHVWHFVGHGGDGQLLLEDSYGDADPVEETVLAATLADCGVRLAVLSACRGAAVAQDVLRGVAPALVAAGTPAAVAMQFAVAEESTRAFTTEFYRALAHGWPIDACVTEGRKALLDMGGGATLDWGVPVVYTRAEDGVLFRTPDAAIDPLAAAQVRLAALPVGRLPDAAPLPAGSLMDLARSPLFVGRDAELRQAASALLEEGAGTPTAAVTGMPGVGKTSLAVELAHRYGQFFAGGVFWLRCADPALVAAEVAACGGPAGLNLEGWEALKADDQAALVRAAWDDPLPRLLIFDGCEDEAVLAAWRPVTGGCRVLITSVRPAWGAALGVRQLPLEVLPRADGVALLRRHRPDLPEGDAGLAALAEELGDLPLALRLAGSYLETYRDDPRLGAPAALLAELRKGALLEHEALRGQELGGGELSVGRSFALSLGQLDAADAEDGAARALLARAAWCAPGVPIARELLVRMVAPAGGLLEQAGQLLKGISALWGAKPEAAPDPERTASRALSRLAALGLLEPEAGGALSVHRLVAAFVRRAQLDPAAREAAERELRAQLTERTSGDAPRRPIGDLLPHLTNITALAFEAGEGHAVELVSVLLPPLFDAGAYRAARSLLERAIPLLERVLGPEHPAIEGCVSYLAMVLAAQGDLAGARASYERALAIMEKARGPDHPDTARACHNLGALLVQMGDIAGARALVERAGRIYERTEGPDSTALAAYLNGVAVLLHSSGEPAAARPYAERALAIWEKARGPDHLDTAVAANNLGSLLHQLGELPAARTHLERCLAAYERAYGPDHPMVAVAVNNLGALLMDQGDLAGARALFERGLGVHERALGADHPDTAMSHHNLAKVLRRQGDLPGARAHLDRALAIREGALGPDSIFTAMVLRDAAALLVEQGDPAAGRERYQRALAVYERVRGPDHRETREVRDALSALPAAGS